MGVVKGVMSGLLSSFSAGEQVELLALIITRVTRRENRKTNSVQTVVFKVLPDFPFSLQRQRATLISVSVGVQGMQRLGLSTLGVFL